MDRQEAYKIVEGVYSQFKGTIQEHQVVQQALKTLAPKPELEAVKEVKAEK